MSLLAGACGHDPDLHLASTTDLVRLTANVQTEPPDSLGHRAARELTSRPRTAVASDLLGLLRHSDSQTRCTAASLLGEFLADTTASSLPPDARQKAETALLALLGESDEKVRASALSGLGNSWVMTRPDRVPEMVGTSIRSLLESGTASLRFQAAWSAGQIGPAVAPEAPTLTAKLEAETDAGVRFALACALGSTGDRHPPARDALTGALDDPAENVRYAATTSLGSLSSIGDAAILRLLRSLADASEAADVRMAAVDSLVKHVRSADETAAVLLAVLDLQPLFAAHYRETFWLAALGKLAAKAPAAGATGEVRKRLEDATRSRVGDLALVATSSLARLACATRDRDLGRRSAVRLLEAVPLILSPSEVEWSQVPDEQAQKSVLEALVELARWPDMQVDANWLRPVFQDRLQSKDWWMRKWAGEQLRRLQ